MKIDELGLSQRALFLMGWLAGDDKSASFGGAYVEAFEELVAKGLGHWSEDGTRANLTPEGREEVKRYFRERYNCTPGRA